MSGAETLVGTLGTSEMHVVAALDKNPIRAIRGGSSPLSH